MKAKLEALMKEYGPIVLYTHFGMFFAVLIGFAIAIQAGAEVESASGGAGLLGAAYVATKLTQPIRIAITVATAPVIARVLRRRKAATEAAAPDVEAP